MNPNDSLAHAYTPRRGQTFLQPQRSGMDTIPSKHQMLLDSGLLVETSRAYGAGSPACAAGACGGTAPMYSYSSFSPVRALADGGQQTLSSACYPSYSAATATFSNIPDVHIPDVVSSYAYSAGPSNLHMGNLFLPAHHHPMVSPSLLSCHDQSHDALETQSVFASSVDSFDPILSSAATTTSANTPFFPPLDEQWIPPPPADYFFDAHMHSSLPGGRPYAPLATPSPLPQPTPTATSTPSTTAKALSASGNKEKDLSHYGVQNPDGSWRCAYPSCTSQTVFRRGCDLRKHYNRHRKHLFCRHKNCPQAVRGGFSSKKDRDRHETKHNPEVPCEWDGCPRMFSRVDNMKDHVRRIHRRRE
ncbi:hypothetical protein BJX96DRAFT_179235 [Aspergillus floccosus]